MSKYIELFINKFFLILLNHLVIPSFATPSSLKKLLRRAVHPVCLTEERLLDLDKKLILFVCRKEKKGSSSTSTKKSAGFYNSRRTQGLEKQMVRKLRFFLNTRILTKPRVE
jgi:hypothetical protein